MTRRIVSDDGLDVVAALEPDLTPQEIEEVRALIEDFNHLLEGWQANWEAIAASLPLDARRDPLSKDAYGRRQLALIRRLQKMFANPEFRGVIYDAIRLGYYQADARWRFDRGEHTRHGIKQRTGSRHGGQQSGIERRAQQRKDQQRVAAEARKVRARHPYHRTKYSTRRLIAALSTTLELKASTVRDYLSQLKIK